MAVDANTTPEACPQPTESESAWDEVVHAYAAAEEADRAAQQAWQEFHAKRAAWVDRYLGGAA